MCVWEVLKTPKTKPWILGLIIKTILRTSVDGGLCSILFYRGRGLFITWVFLLYNDERLLDCHSHAQIHTLLHQH